MARIPDADDLGERIIPRGRAPRYEDRSGVIASQGLAQAAQTVGNALVRLGEEQDQFNYGRAKSSLQSADIELRKKLETDQDWETYEKRYSDGMTKARETASKLIRGRAARNAFDESAKVYIERGSGEVRAQARRKEVDWGRATLADSLESDRNSALGAQDKATRSSIITNVFDTIQGAKEKGYISEQEAVAQRQRWTESYADGYIDTLSTQGQVDALRSPKENPAAFMSPDKRAVRLKQAENTLRIERERAEAERKAKNVELRQALNDQLRDIQIGAQMGLPVSVPSKKVLQSAFGEAEGTQRYDLAVKAQSLSGDVAQLQQLSNEEIINKVNSYKPTKVEGVADQAQLYSSIAGSASKIIKERAEDPAGYLTQFAPSTQTAWTQFQQDGSDESRTKYLAALEADRERLGLPKGDILPNAYASQLAEELSNPKSAESLATRMEAEAARWGDRWPEVHSQVAKDLPDVAAVIGSGIDRSAAVTLASTAGLKDKELQALLPPNVKWTDVQDDVSQTFSEVQRAFPAEGARTFEAIRDSATRLAVSYMQAGTSRGNAVKRAYKELIDKQYEVGEYRNVTFLIPRQYDADEIQEAAERTIDEFAPSIDMISAPPGEDPARYVDRARERIRKDAYWVASGDGKGLRMYLGTRPTPIVRSFEDLQRQSSERRAKEQADVVTSREKAMRARSSPPVKEVKEGGGGR